MSLLRRSPGEQAAARHEADNEALPIRTTSDAERSVQPVPIGRVDVDRVLAIPRAAGKKFAPERV